MSMVETAVDLLYWVVWKMHLESLVYFIFTLKAFRNDNQPPVPRLPVELELKRKSGLCERESTMIISSRSYTGKQRPSNLYDGALCKKTSAESGLYHLEARNVLDHQSHRWYSCQRRRIRDRFVKRVARCLVTILSLVQG